MYKFDPPVFINVRDRVSDLRQLVAWLEKAGHERITLLDNDSTYPPLLEYLEASPHEVVYLRENLGSYSLWKRGLDPDEMYVFTDPDVVPLEECPLNAVARLRFLLESYAEFPKAGLGLYLDDVPSSCGSLEWERSLVCEHPRPQHGIPSFRLQPGVFASLVDTTFALHRPGCPGAPTRAIRTGYPFQVKHLPWYVRRGNLTAEDAYYLARAKPGAGYSSWAERPVPA